MNGGNGGWPVLYSSNPVTTNKLDVVIDEDILTDAERRHTKEQLAYIVMKKRP